MDAVEQEGVEQENDVAEATRATAVEATTPTDELAKKVIAWEKPRHKAMNCFKHADALSEEIIPRLKKRKNLKISDGRFARVKDNFARKNKAFKQAGIERFEIEILSAD